MSVSAINPLVLDFVEGITQYSNRVGLKTLMSNYGDVDVCWIPPVWDREKEVAYVKFKDQKGAEMAMQAMSGGQVTMHGVALKAKYRVGQGRAPPLQSIDGRGGRDRENDVGRVRGGRTGRDDREIYGSRELFIADMKARGKDWRQMDSRARDKKKKDKKEKKKKKDKDRSRERGEPGGEVEVVVQQLLGEKQGLGLKLDGLVISSFELEEAQAFGWRVGDRIVGLNGKRVEDVEALQEDFVRIKQSGELPIVFMVARGEEATDVPPPPEEF